MHRVFWLVLLLSFVGVSNSQEDSSFLKDTLALIKGAPIPETSRDKYLGNLIQRWLEEQHYSKKKINSTVSSDAFGLYIKRLDYRKRFLLQSDVDELSSYKTKLGEEMVSGNFEIVKKATEI